MAKKERSFEVPVEVIARSWTGKGLEILVQRIVEVDKVLASLGPMQQLALGLAVEQALAGLRGVLAGVAVMRGPAVAEQEDSEGEAHG